MKRLIALLICIFILTAFVAPSVSASESEKSEGNDFFGALSYTCNYDVTSDQIIISGTVDHNIMTRYEGYTISVYAIPMGITYEEVISDPESKPVSSSAMALKLTFHVGVKRISDIYSQYAVVFTSPTGEKILAAQPMYPSVVTEPDYNWQDRTAYKGILIDSAAKAGNSGAGTVIIDVHLERIFGDSSDSILCPMNDTYIYVNKSYLTEIDRKVVTATTAGSRVYLRYLLSCADNRLSYAVSEDGRYGIPNLYSEEVMSTVSAISTFLADRYDGGKGRISGLVVGTRVDDTQIVNCVGEMSEEQYTQLYARYMLVVANAVRIVDPTLDIVIPLSDKNNYSQSGGFLENTVALFDSMLSEELNCSVMLEANSAPLGITNNSLAEGIDLSFKGDSSVINSNNISVFISYVERLLRRYDSAPTNVIYMWNVSPQLTGTALCCAYSYNYYSLYSHSRISSFVVSFDEDSYYCYDSLDNIFKHIDTSSASKYTEPLAQYFGRTSWYSIIGSSVSNKPTSSLIETQMTQERPKDVIGEFVYIDFSSTSVLSIMSEGQKCASIRSDYNDLGERAICVNSTSVSMGEAVECIGLFDYPESYKYTPKMALVICVEGDSKQSLPLYEVSLTLGSGSDRIVACGVVKDGEKTELVFDVSAYGTAYLANYMKVSVRCLTGDSENMTVRLHRLKGYSSQYYSEDLAALIDEQRQQIKNSGEDDEGFNSKLLITVVGIAFAVVSVGIGLMMVFKKEEAEEAEREQDKS